MPALDPGDSEWRRFIRLANEEKALIEKRLSNGECASLEDYRDFCGQIRAYAKALEWAKEISREADRSDEF